MYFLSYGSAAGHIVGAGQPFFQAARETLAQGGIFGIPDNATDVSVLSVCPSLALQQQQKNYTDYLICPCLGCICKAARDSNRSACFFDDA